MPKTQNNGRNGFEQAYSSKRDSFMTEPAAIFIPIYKPSLEWYKKISL